MRLPRRPETRPTFGFELTPHALSSSPPSLPPSLASCFAFPTRSNQCESVYFQQVGTREVRRNASANAPPKYSCGVGPVVGNACENCGGRFQMAGPIWSEPIHDKEWVRDILREVRGLSHEDKSHGKGKDGGGGREGGEVRKRRHS